MKQLTNIIILFFNGYEKTAVSGKIQIDVDYLNFVQCFERCFSMHGV